jgi:hypothetical protein
MEASEGYDPKRLTPDLDLWTLQEVTNMDHRDLKPYNGITEKPDVKLTVLSTSNLEIVETGNKGDWPDGDPPIGLFPLM